MAVSFFLYINYNLLFDNKSPCQLSLLAGDELS